MRALPSRLFGIILLCFGLAGSAPAQSFRIFKRAPCLEGRFAGQVLDFTANHGADRRIWSEALHEKRDLYVYLPPGFDPTKQYPLIFWLHGIEQDEKGFIDQGLPEIDAAMACGKLPPTIIAIPDGSIKGRPGMFSPNSGFLNTHAGNFEDFLFNDVYGFVRAHFPIRPEREAHVLAGVSIGGGAAFYHGIVRRQEFGVAVGIFPPLNLRWVGCHGWYFANFDPEHWGWREHYCFGLLPAGKFYGGLITVPWRRLVHPLYGDGHQVLPQLSRDNPIEVLDRYDLKPGELEMLVAYGGKDQFNIDAQVESFLYRANERGLTIKVLYDPRGRHDAATALRFIPDIVDWLAPRLEPFRAK
jgi:S-formylglutathione hydrolase FrmB